MVYCVAFSINRFGGWNYGEYLVRWEWTGPTMPLEVCNNPRTIKGFAYTIPANLPH